MAGEPRPYLVNLDYGLVLLAVLGVGRIAPRLAYAAAFLALTIAVAVDALQVTSQPIFDGVMRISDYLDFIDLWPWRALAPWIFGALIACALLAYPAAKASRGALLLVAALVALLAGDQLLQSHAGPDGRPINLVSSSLRDLIRSYVGFVPSGLQTLTPFPGPRWRRASLRRHPRKFCRSGWNP
jgi:hypothetical protein